MDGRQSITEFLDWLRNGHSDFDASDTQYLAAQQLLERILRGDAGEVPPLPAWKTLLAPVLCSSPAQQSEFHQLFSKWFEQIEAPPLPPPQPPPVPRNLDKWLYGMGAC